MIGVARPGSAAVILALCAACLGTLPGRVQCGPCPLSVTVTVSGLQRLAGDGWRLRVCVGGLPCTDVRVPTRETPPSCGPVACRRPDPDTLQITLNGEAH